MCSLDSLEGCSALIETIEKCKSDFRRTVDSMSIDDFKKPIYLTTSEYPALSATAAYWQGEISNLQNYIETLKGIKKVDISQAQDLMLASTLQDEIAQNLAQCVYKLDEGDSQEIYCKSF